MEYDLILNWDETNRFRPESDSDRGGRVVQLGSRT